MAVVPGCNVLIAAKTARPGWRNRGGCGECYKIPPFQSAT
jgi:hypothetical protein